LLNRLQEMQKVFVGQVRTLRLKHHRVVVGVVVDGPVPLHQYGVKALQKSVVGHKLPL
jgi:hypothetical protein